MIDNQLPKLIAFSWFGADLDLRVCIRGAMEKCSERTPSIKTAFLRVYSFTNSG